MELFKGQSLLEFTERFKTDLDCEEYLASLKWEDGIFTASKTHNSKEYTITQIRRNRRKKQMKKQKMKLLLISLFLIGTVSSCENVVNNNTEKDPLNESLSIESDTKINNPLANKKFYYLDKEENGELTLSIFPYLEDDYDMAKIIFTDSMLIDGWNIMEPHEWKIERVSQQDSLLIYHLQMMDYPETQKTFYFNYNEKKGILYRKDRDTTYILIDSLKSNSVRKVKAEWIP